MKSKVEVSSVLVDLNSNMWGSCFRISDEVASQLIDGKDRRVLCTINKANTIHCALMPSPQGYFIMISKEVKRKNGLSLGDKVQLGLSKDDSKYGMPVSEEFQVIIIDDPEIEQYFHKLTAGKQRNLIHLVNKIKNPSIKLNRALAIAEHLRREKGSVDFKRLNEVIKEFNQIHKII